MFVFVFIYTPYLLCACGSFTLDQIVLAIHYDTPHNVQMFFNVLVNCLFLHTLVLGTKVYRRSTLYK